MNPQTMGLGSGHVSRAVIQGVFQGICQETLALGTGRRASNGMPGMVQGMCQETLALGNPLWWQGQDSKEYSRESDLFLSATVVLHLHLHQEAAALPIDWLPDWD